MFLEISRLIKWIIPLASFKLDQSLFERYVCAKKVLSFLCKTNFRKWYRFIRHFIWFWWREGLSSQYIPWNSGRVWINWIIFVFLCVFKDLWHTTNSFRLTMFLILLAFIGSLQYTNTFTESKIAFASFGIIQAYLNNYKR